MNLFGFNIHISRPTRSPRPQTKSVSISEWRRGEDLDYNDGPVLANAYQQVVWVYRAINVLAEQIANVPFRFSIGQAGGEHLITAGPLVDFYNRPHPHLDRFQYWELRVMWLMLRGECFRIPVYDTPSSSPSSSSSYSYSYSPSSSQSKIENRKSKIRHVLLLDPAHFRHIVEHGQLLGWHYTGFGPQSPLANQVFLPEEVWFEKLPNPFDFWRGLAPLTVAGLAARTDFAAGAFMSGLMENNADSGVIVRSEKPMSDEHQQQVIAALRSRKRRAGTADRPVFLNGVTEMLKPELSSSDLQFLENRKFSRAEICAAFGVPEEIVTTTDPAKYDVMAGARLNFIENRVAPMCRRLEADENATTIPAIIANAGASLSGSEIQNQKSKIENTVGWFDLDSLPILQQARRNRLASARTGFDMGIPFNELNHVLDLGFRPLPWGNRGYLAANLNEVGATEPSATGSDAQSKAQTPQPQQADSRFRPSIAPSLHHSITPLLGSGGDCGAAENTFAQALELVAGIGRAGIGQGAIGQAGTGQAGLEQAGGGQAGIAPEAAAATADDPSVPVHASRITVPRAIELRAAASKLRRFLFEQRARVLARLETAFGNPTATARPNGQRLTTEAWFDLADENQRLLAIFRSAGLNTATELIAHPGVAQASSPASSGSVSLPGPPDPTTVSSVNRLTLEALARALECGLAAGENCAQLSDRVRTVYNDAARHRAVEFATALFKTETL